MIVNGYGPIQTPPYVPRFIITPTGVFTREGPADTSCSFQMTNPVELRNDQWLGVCPDGGIDLFELDKEGVWKTKAAMDAVSFAATIEDPEKTVRVLRAAADMIGLDLPTLIIQLQRLKHQGESLADTYLRTGGKEVDIVPDELPTP